MFNTKAKAVYTNLLADESHLLNKFNIKIFFIKWKLHKINVLMLKSVKKAKL